MWQGFWNHCDKDSGNIDEKDDSKEDSLEEHSKPETLTKYFKIAVLP